MIKVKLRELVDSVSSGALGRFGSDIHLPMKIKHRLKSISKQAKAQFQTYQESYRELCEQYGQMVPSERPDVFSYSFPDPKKKAIFLQEAEGLLAVEIEIEGDTFTFSDLVRKFDAPEALSADDLGFLEWLILDDPAEAKEEVKESAEAAGANS